MRCFRASEAKRPAGIARKESARVQKTWKFYADTLDCYGETAGAAAGLALIWIELVPNPRGGVTLPSL
jgi:hypothetical protein